LPKQKSHRGARKRFKVSAGGKILHQHSHTSHILTKKTTKRKRGLRKVTQISPAFHSVLDRLLLN
jgi:large subunit ribosomal protein L35